MLLNSVWAQTGIECLRGLLCIGCVEARLGRRLETDDFGNAPINWLRPTQSSRLRERIGPNGPPGIPAVLLAANFSTTTVSGLPAT